jgi:hypothetical protein
MTVPKLRGNCQAPGCTNQVYALATGTKTWELRHAACRALFALETL